MKYVEPFGLSEREKSDKRHRMLKKLDGNNREENNQFFDVGIFLQGHASLKYFFFFFLIPFKKGINHK